MLENIFNIIINLSISGSIVAIIILAFKYMARNIITPRLTYMVWLVLLIKLLVPISVPSSISIYNVVPIESTFVGSEIIIETPSEKITPNEKNEFINNNDTNKNHLEFSLNNNYEKTQSSDWQKNIIPYVWIIGFFLVLLWFGITALTVKQRINKNRLDTNNDRLSLLDYCKELIGVKGRIDIIISESIKSPFIFGLIRPAIIMPKDILASNDEGLIKHILLHEIIHIKRRDYLIKALFMLAVAIHWFNPLIWFVFIIMNKDCEKACDAAVLDVIGNSNKKQYASSLLYIANTNKRNLGEQILAFGESDIKGRIKRIMAFKEYSRVSKLIAIAVVLILAVTVLTVANNKEKVQNNKIITDEARLGDGERFIDIETQAKVEELLNTIVNEGPQFSSNPYDYIEKNKDAFDELVKIDAKGLHYMLGELEKSNADGLREYIMSVACAKIMGVYNEEYGIGDSGREWYYKFALRFNLNITENTAFFSEVNKQDLDSVVYSYILDYNRGRYYSGEAGFAACKIFDTNLEGNVIYLYTVVRYNRFGFEDGHFTIVSGSGAIPTVIRVKENENKEYEVVEYLEPRDGGEYASSIKKLFPNNLHETILKRDENLEKELWDIIETRAKAYLSFINRSEALVIPRVKKDTEDGALRAIYSVNLMKPHFPSWEGTREILVRTGGPAPGIIIRATLETKATKISNGEYDILLKRIWHANINGEQPISFWQYRVKGENVTLIDYEDNDAAILGIK